MIWLVGTGPMAQDYAAVFHDLELDFLVVGRDPSKTERFATKLGQGWRSGGVDAALEQVAAGKLVAPSHAVVATQVDALAPVAAALAPVCPRLLVEKPGAVEAAEMRSLANHPAVASGQTHIYIGYNRRFIASVVELRRRISEEGPVLSVIAEFDEPVPRIEALPTDAAIKARWGYANASHVLDLVWHLCGRSTMLRKSGDHDLGPKLDWHPTGSVYTGMGITESGTQYLYHGNYASVGRWRLSLSLRRKRYILMPLEILELVEGNSVIPIAIPLPSYENSALKPGLRGQVQAFMEDDPSRLLATASYQQWHLAHLASIFGYPA